MKKSLKTEVTPAINPTGNSMQIEIGSSLNLCRGQTENTLIHIYTPNAPLNNRFLLFNNYLLLVRLPASGSNIVGD